MGLVQGIEERGRFQKAEKEGKNIPVAEKSLIQRAVHLVGMRRRCRVDIWPQAARLRDAIVPDPRQAIVGLPSHN